MKKLLLIALFLFLLSVCAVHAQQGRFGQIVNSSFVNQLPDPVEPGNLVEASFRIENLGEQLARDVEVEVMTEYPLSIRPGESATKNVGSIESLQKGDDGVIVKYKLLVDANAPDGEHEVRLRYREQGSTTWVKSEPFQVRVQSTNAILGVEKVTTTPKTIAPGKQATITLSVKNYASSLLRDVDISLDFTNIPLNPIGSANEKIVRQLEPGQKQDIDFTVIADPDADAKVYKIPTTITYKDVLQNSFTKENTVGVIVGDEPEVTVTVDSLSVYSRGKKGDLSVKFVNKGTSDIKFLTIRTQSTNDVKLIGSVESYIGNLDSDDFSSADFEVYIEEGQGNVILPVVAEYKDANNNHYQKTVDLTLPIYSSEDLRKYGIEGGSGSGMIPLLLLIIVALVGVIIFRKRIFRS